MQIASTSTPLGSLLHSHRGVETVTVVYDGYLAHRDTAGHDGSISPGDVQRIAAGAGLRHAELYNREFAQRGGTPELLQL